MTDEESYAPAVPLPVERRLPMEFTGTGSEYFRIWIVNLLLTIVTLGIYSAWAKVRKMQYFYRNTRVDGAVFDYHGRPAAILKGRLIALALVILYNFSFQFSVILGILSAAALALAMPWLLAQSQRFRLHNSSYRGLRFRFLGSVREAYAIFGIPLVILFGVGGWFFMIGGREAAGVRPSSASLAVIGLVYLGLMLLWPYLHFRFKQYQHANSALGNTRSTFIGRAARFYVYYGIAAAVIIAVGILLIGGISLMGRSAGAGGVIAVFVGVLFVYLVMLGAGPYIAARVQNHVWNATRIGPVGFESTVQARKLIWIVITNLLLIVFTLGLFTPFAAVRAARYKVQSVTVVSDDDLAGFVGTAGAEVAAVGEGAADLFDVDFAL